MAEEWVRTHPDCMQTGMHASGALIPTEAQLSGLERRQNSVMDSRKTVMTVRDEGENGAKVRTSDAFAEESMSVTAIIHPL